MGAQEFLETVCHKEWEHARELYLKGELRIDAMRKLIAYRTATVGVVKGEPIPPLIQEVIDETYAYAKTRWIALKKANPAVPEPAPISFGAAGSQSPTSDIDYNIKGDYTEYAVAVFNKRFRSEFGVESGTYFDVNVYAKDFLPTIDDKGVKPTVESDGTNLEAVGESTPAKASTETALEGSDSAADDQKQELFSLSKCRCI